MVEPNLGMWKTKRKDHKPQNRGSTINREIGCIKGDYAIHEHTDYLNKMYRCDKNDLKTRYSFLNW